MTETQTHVLSGSTRDFATGVADIPPVARRANSAKPKLGFLGVGWIGRHRLEAIAASGLAQVIGVADACFEVARKTSLAIPDSQPATCLDDLLNMGVEGVVIATPSALHAQQAITALEAGVAVFCQKPLGRNVEETRSVINAARAVDKLLGVDLSYRFITGAQRVHEMCRLGDLGKIFAAELVFHNGYGPDKPWFYDPKLSGGGCVIDLGIHLLDLAFWNLNYPAIEAVTSRLFANGRPVRSREEAVEDYAECRLDLAGGISLRLVCSWKLQAGRDAIIRAGFYGTRGGAALENLDGSFYRFKAERFEGAKSELVDATDETWGGRAAVDWVRRLGAGLGFDAEVEHLALVARGLDAIYDVNHSSGGGGTSE